MTMLKFTIIFLMCAVPTWAYSTDHLPTSIEQDNTQYERCKSYTLRYGFILKVAEIGWYAPSCVKSKPVLQATNKIIRFHYLKDVSADFFKESAEEYFLINLNNSAEQQSLKQPLIDFNANYTDIKAGEYFDLVHVDETNLSLYKNQQLLSVTQNRLLSKNYFNIWFGDKPVVNKLKKAFN